MERRALTEEIHPRDSRAHDAPGLAQVTRRRVDEKSGRTDPKNVGHSASFDEVTSGRHDRCEKRGLSTHQIRLSHPWQPSIRSRVAFSGTCGWTVRRAARAIRGSWFRSTGSSNLHLETDGT